MVSDVTYPNPDCTACGGDGVDNDPYCLFDYPCIGPCPSCWPADAEPAEKPMASDVERVALQICDIGLGAKVCPCADSGVFRCHDELPGRMAKAAMRATLELMAEVVLTECDEPDYTWTLQSTADWLTQQAKEVG